MRNLSQLRRRLDRRSPRETPRQRLVAEVAQRLRETRDLAGLSAAIERHADFRLVARRHDDDGLLLDVLLALRGLLLGPPSYLGEPTGHVVTEADAEFAAEVFAAMRATRDPRLVHL